jgi:hypothetical protein
VLDKKYWLVWAVYATEFGYEYSGAEYWQSFAVNTPGWSDDNRDRTWIRQECFERFASEFGGAIPKGPFARKFTNICWPITHSILPTDLQNQFARLLYNIRSQISTSMLSSPLKLGELIQRCSYKCSSRFQKLAEEPMLTGQITAALLYEDRPEGSDLIYPETLHRISKDLESTRVSRDQLYGARKSVWSNPGSRRRNGDGLSNQEIADRLDKINIAPRRILSRCFDGSQQWQLNVEFPELTPVLLRHPNLLEVVEKSRFSVACSSGRKKPGRNLVAYGSYKDRLEKWPECGVSLLEFDESNPQLDEILNANCSLRSEEPWVFKKRRDGTANEILGKQVRAGQCYLVVCRELPIIEEHEAVKQLQLKCSGVAAISLDLPETVDSTLNEILDSLNLHFVKNICVWPAGVCAARWDGEESVDWNDGETPCIGIQTNQEVDEYILDILPSGDQLKITPGGGVGIPAFVELPDLHVGNHTLTIEAIGTGEDPKDIVVKILEPTSWDREIEQEGLIQGVVEPYAPSLEQIWQEEAAIHVYGPEGRKVDCRIILYSRTTDAPLESELISALKLPIDTQQWRKRFQELKKDRVFSHSYDLAHRVELEFSAGEFGLFNLRAEREFTPLRWVVQRINSGFKLQVVDDTGEDTEVKVSCFPVDSPDIAKSIETTSGEFRPLFKGLYVARTGSYERSIFVPFFELQLEDLGLGTEFPLRIRNRHPKDMLELIRAVDLWSGARLPGDFLSKMIRDGILGRLGCALFGTINGHAWTNVENALFEGDGNDVVTLGMRAVSKPAEKIVFEKIIESASDLQSTSVRVRVEALCKLAENRLGLSTQNIPGPGNLAWLSEFSLRLASWPAGIRSWAGDDLKAGVSRVIENPSLLRAARFMVLILSREEIHNIERTVFFQDGWYWS